MRGSLILGSLGSALVVMVTTLAGCAEDPSELGEADGSTESDMVAASSGNAQVSGVGTSVLRIRSAPSTTASTVGTFANGAHLQVQCQATGDSVSGNTGWDYVAKYKGYVSDHYVTKLGASFPACDGSGASVSTTPVATSTSNASGTGNGAGLVAEARKWVGTHETGNNCQPFSTALGRPCEAWCADFVQYIWQQGGMNTEGVTAYAGSFLTNGQDLGTLKPRDSSDVQPGDAVVWARTATDAAHVGMVTEVLANGDVRVINGNYADKVEEVVNARSSQVEGYGIAGFISPVPQ